MAAESLVVRGLFSEAWFSGWFPDTRQMIVGHPRFGRSIPRPLCESMLEALRWFCTWHVFKRNNCATIWANTGTFRGTGLSGGALTFSAESRPARYHRNLKLIENELTRRTAHKETEMAGMIESRLAERKIELPEAAAPVANYIPYVVAGNLVFVSGQITLENGTVRYQGKVGDDIPLDEAQRAARLCGLNLIAQVKAACDGDLDRVERVVKLGGFVNGAADFVSQPLVINGASDLMVEVFGDAGKHSRSAVGVSSLPFGVAVEIDGIFQIKQ